MRGAEKLGQRMEHDSSADFDEALEHEAPRDVNVLRLYVTGMTPRSQAAIKNIRAILEEHLQGQYDLQIIDIYQNPQLAEGEQIIAAPTLIKKLPMPIRRFIGDLSDKEKILMGLDIKMRDGHQK